LTEAGGDSASEYESDVEDLTVPTKKPTGDFGQHAFRKDRIFKHLKIQDKFV